MWADSDPILPLETGEKFAASLGGSLAHVIRDAGHFLQEDAGAEIGARIVEWLDSVGVGRRASARGCPVEALDVRRGADGPRTARTDARRPPAPSLARLRPAPSPLRRDPTRKMLRTRRPPTGRATSPGTQAEDVARAPAQAGSRNIFRVAGGTTGGQGLGEPAARRVRKGRPHRPA